MSSDDEHPVAPPAPKIAYRNPFVLRRLFYLFMFGYIFALVVSLLLDVSELELLNLLASGIEIEDSVAEANDSRQAAMGVALVLVLLTTSILFLTLLARLNHNARALTGATMKFTPGWTVGWFFVPFANLFKPYQAVKEIWSVSGCPPNHTLIVVWWGMWIISCVVGQYVFRMSLRAEDLEQLIFVSQVGIAADAFDIPLTVVAILVLHVIASYQERLQKGTGSDPADPVLRLENI